MLRVYSVLYIERLWNNDTTVAQNKHLIQSSNSSIHSQIIVTDAYSSREIQIDSNDQQEQEERDYQENHEQDDQAQLQLQEPLDTTDFQTAETSNILQEFEILENKIDLDTSVDNAVPQQQNEHIINSLAIDTNNLQDFSAAQAKARADAEAESAMTPAAVTAERSADHPTSISSSSSILPPLTPSSVHSIGVSGGNDASEKPRTTSLIRRETQKINDRRKSLTKKIKRVLTVKSETKRNSV